MNPPVIHVDNLHKTFDGKPPKYVLDGIDLRVEPGTVLGLLGRNGSGKSRVGPLSVGQLQTLGIVLALGHEPELLILDEPVASLDPSARREFLRTLLEAIDDGRRTIVFSTHITSDLERVANRIALLKDGQIAFHGELDDLKDRVKRLRIAGAEALPGNLTIPGALQTEIDGPVALVTVDDFDDELVDSLRASLHAEVTVEDLNLEEIFVALHERKTPPHFSRLAATR